LTVLAEEEQQLQHPESINSLHPRISFTTEFSADEIRFLDLCFYKGEKGGRISKPIISSPPIPNSMCMPHLPTHQCWRFPTWHPNVGVLWTCLLSRQFSSDYAQASQMTEADPLTRFGSV